MTFLLILCLLGTAAWVAAGVVRERLAPGPRDAVDKFSRALSALDPAQHAPSRRRPPSGRLPIGRRRPAGRRRRRRAADRPVQRAGAAAHRR